MSSLTPRPSTSSTGRAATAPRLSNAGSPSAPLPLDPTSSSLSQQNFHATLPLAISLSPSDLPSGADTVLAGHYTYYTTVRRISYLPLILQEVKEALVDLVVGEEAKVREEEMWFEVAGVPLRWHWPIGLLYDVSASMSPSYSGSSAAGPSSRKVTSTSPWAITLRLGPLPTSKLLPPSSTPILGISPDDGPFASLIEGTKQAFMAMLKEGDFIRNGNTKKVNNLRRVEQDGIWEALKTGDYQQYSSLVSKIFPPPSAYPTEGSALTRASSSRVTSINQTDTAPSSPKLPVYPQSTSAMQAEAAASSLSLTPSLSAPPMAEENSLPGSSNTIKQLKGHSLPNLKAIPVKFVLQGGTVLQEAVPPLAEDRSSGMTLQGVLSGLFPALFPAPPPVLSEGEGSLGIDFQDSTAVTGVEERSLHSQAGQTNGGVLAVAMIQGIVVPLESTLPWLARTMGGADGWLTIILLLRRSRHE